MQGQKKRARASGVARRNTRTGCECYLRSIYDLSTIYRRSIYDISTIYLRYIYDISTIHLRSVLMQTSLYVHCGVGIDSSSIFCVSIGSKAGRGQDQG